MSFFNLDWLNESADVYVCDRCGFLHWFLAAGMLDPAHDRDTADMPPEPIPSDDATTESECLNCGAIIPAGTASCLKCGWTYR